MIGRATDVDSCVAPGRIAEPFGRAKSSAIIADQRNARRAKARAVYGQHDPCTQRRIYELLGHCAGWRGRELFRRQ